MHPFLTPEKRDGFSVRRASSPTKCNTTLRPARHGAVVRTLPAVNIPTTPTVIPNGASRRFSFRLAPARRSACAERNLSSSGIPIRRFARRVRTQLFACVLRYGFRGDERRSARVAILHSRERKTRMSPCSPPLGLSTSHRKKLLSAWRVADLRSARTPRQLSGNAGGLNGSTQHQLEVYLQESQQLKSFASVDSNGTLPPSSSD